MIAGLRQTLRLEVRSTQDLMLLHEKKSAPSLISDGKLLKKTIGFQRFYSIVF